MALPSAAMLTRQYCLPILHKPVQAESLSWAQHTSRGTAGRGDNATCLPQLLHESLSGLVHDWTRNSDHPPLHGPCHWVRASGGCASPTSLYSRLESSTLILCFSSGFEVLLYLVNWLWSLVVCATRQKQTTLEPVACTSQVNFHCLSELKDHLCLKINCWKNEPI